MRTRQVAYAGMFAALIAVASLFSRFFPNIEGVPFSLQPLAVLLTGYLLDRKTAVLSVTAYVLMGLIGIPVFASPPYGGPGYFLAPSFGYLLGFIAAVWVMGTVLERMGRSAVAYAAAGLAGVVVYYLIGVPYLYCILNFYLGKTVDIVKALEIGLIPFLAFDLVKVLVAALVSYEVRKRSSVGQA